MILPPKVMTNGPKVTVVSVSESLSRVTRSMVIKMDVTACLFETPEQGTEEKEKQTTPFLHDL